MALTPALQISQSLSGETITITDVSDYAGQGINVATVTRAIQVTDANGNVIATPTFPSNTALLTTFTITKDLYLTIVANFTYNGTLYTSTKTYLSTNFYQYTQATYVSTQSCGCNANKYIITDNVTKAREAWYAAQYAFLSGLGPKAQSSMDDANTLINTAK